MKVSHGRAQRNKLVVSTDNKRDNTKLASRMGDIALSPPTDSEKCVKWSNSIRNVKKKLKFF